MRSRFLFPHYFRSIGYLCFAIIILCAILIRIIHPQVSMQSIHHTTIPGIKTWHDITALLILGGLLFIAFSKEKVEDEHITLIRLESLQWAVYLNYFMLAVCVVLANTMELMHIILTAVWAPLIFFIIRFRWMIYRLNRDAGKETDLS
ncbi:hypothetical protein EWM62_13765 [Mucilaginibacter terrigena]|uniref:Uncharacterized protein n=1 Tax=Mucilaginibacter terrigena TaxID=2492395 RepID=A0A4Q5LIZ8_9SPHI|nr:hypothetical protein [Mucilaginibacter terrigena]RYU89391.1 hypothetical protein EWM62_13765 [Mucilaginibacter terrigena]